MNRQRRKTENQKMAGDRGQWASKREYILVVAGSVVGLGNVWRFPYLCYKNGGGAFLVPYGLLAVVCGIPLFLLETSVGQYTQEGFITSWRKMCPLMQGIGFGQLIISLCCFIYVLIEAWALVYLVFSFRSQLPWASCENSWNTGKFELWFVTNLFTLPISHQVVGLIHKHTMKTTSMKELGSVRWELALCLLACWIFCYFSIWKGVRSSGKVAYFTALFPYLILLILLIRGLTLPGAWDGIYYYLYPDLNRLTNLEVVWIEAGSQIFFSYSVTEGTLNVLGSYNECYNFDKTIHMVGFGKKVLNVLSLTRVCCLSVTSRDCFWLCLLNSGTSFVSGFVVFSVLGFMAHKQGVTVDNVAESGPGLAFIVYPQATAMMPLPQFWTVCFFLMLILLTVDSHFVIVESFITTVSDLFPKWFRAPVRHEIFVLIICVSSFLIHLTLGGIYVFQLIEFYGSTRVCQNFMAVCECLAVGWIFGADRFTNIIEDMTGQRPSVFFKLCWKYIIPLLSLTSFILYLVNYKRLRINDWYTYPDWAYALGWTMTLSSVLMVPLWAAGQMCLTAGTLRQVSAQRRVLDHVSSFLWNTSGIPL
uniref:Transporter n=1 Tax=Dicentrarchus labrax TaxID=13489 RepID=A0A8C4FEH5_DICLA